MFAAKTAGAEDNIAEDVVIFDDVKAEKLKAYFRDTNTVSYTVDESKNADDETVKKLTVTIIGKTKDELMDLYGLTAKQRLRLKFREKQHRLTQQRSKSKSQRTS